MGFGVVVALMLIVVAMGLKALAGMDDTIENIVADNNVKIEALSTLRDSERQLAIAVRDLTLVTDDKAMEEAEARMTQATSHYTKSMALLRERVTSEQGRKMLAEIAAG